MNPLRLLVVTERFWPVVEPEVLAVEHLCLALADRGHGVRVLTRSWQKYWSSSLRVGELPVIRLPYSSRSRLGRLRQARLLSQWLEVHRDDYELIIAAPTEELCGPIVQFAVRREIPVCLWQASPTSVRAWQELTNRLIGGFFPPGADVQWIVADRVQAHPLQAIGVDSSRIAVMGQGVDCRPQTETTRALARLALAENNRLLSVESSEPLIICLNSWKLSATIEWIDAWRWVRQAFPAGRLWLIGDRPENANLWEHIRHRELGNEVLMPGCFDDWTDLLKAADLMIVPESTLTPPYAALLAMQSGLPLLVPSSEEFPEPWLRDGANGFTYSPGDPRRSARRLIEVLEQKSTRAAVADGARDFVRAHYDLATIVPRFEQLAAGLMKRRKKVRS